MIFVILQSGLCITVSSVRKPCIWVLAVQGAQMTCYLMDVFQIFPGTVLGVYPTGAQGGHGGRWSCNRLGTISERSAECRNLIQSFRFKSPNQGSLFRTLQRFLSLVRGKLLAFGEWFSGAVRGECNATLHLYPLRLRFWQYPRGRSNEVTPQTLAKNRPDTRPIFLTLAYELFPQAHGKRAV